MPAPCARSRGAGAAHLPLRRPALHCAAPALRDGYHVQHLACSAPCAGSPIIITEPPARLQASFTPAWQPSGLRCALGPRISNSPAWARSICQGGSDGWWHSLGGCIGVGLRPRRKKHPASHACCKHTLGRQRFMHPGAEASSPAHAGQPQVAALEAEAAALRAEHAALSRRVEKLTLAGRLHRHDTKVQCSTGGRPGAHVICLGLAERQRHVACQLPGNTCFLCMHVCSSENPLATVQTATQVPLSGVPNSSPHPQLTSQSTRQLPRPHANCALPIHAGATERGAGGGGAALRDACSGGFCA